MKIHFLNVNTIVMKALSRALSPFVAGGKFKLVNKSEQADCVVAMHLKDLGLTYNPEKMYVALMQAADEKGIKLPPNVIVLQRIDVAIPDLLAIFSRVKPVEDDVVSDMPLFADAKTILVVDDMSRHRTAARRLLLGHEVTVADGYEAAMRLLSEKQFEVVLTDLKLPMSSRNIAIGGAAFGFGREVEYGFLLMLEAAWRGAKYVAVVTDLSHHSDAYAAAFDHFANLTFTIEDAVVKLMPAPMVKTSDGSVKDWGKAFQMLLDET